MKQFEAERLHALQQGHDGVLPGAAPRETERADARQFLDQLTTTSGRPARLSGLPAQLPGRHTDGHEDFAVAAKRDPRAGRALCSCVRHEDVSQAHS